MIRQSIAVSVIVVTGWLGCAGLGRAKERETPKKTPIAWSYDEALEQLRFSPRDAYVQYLVLQLGRNAGRQSDAEQEIEQLDPPWRRGQPNRRADLFSLFAGAAAVQEALQLDTMRGASQAAKLADPKQNKVAIDGLKGPTAKSHPWGKMLAAATAAGKKPEMSPLAMCVPEDQLYVEFRALSKLLEISERGNLWSMHLMSQGAHSARSPWGAERVWAQLAMLDGQGRPPADDQIAEVALTATDVYFAEGTGVTLLFRAKDAAALKADLERRLATAEAARPDATRTTGKVGDVAYVQVATPDRALSAFSAWPKPDVHVRSNSLAALKRVLDVIAGRGDVGPLGASAEMKYIRTLMARGDEREDGLIYLSDPFIHYLVSAELKITESRRMICYNHLRMIGHAAMLYRTQYGEAPNSLQQLAGAKCLPDLFERVDGEGRGIVCPCGGKYAADRDGRKGVCSYHGHADFLLPNREIPQSKATQEEADQYRAFVEQYSRYWQRFFDPIAIRVQMTPKQYRVETIVLPLLDNSIYTGMATVLGGEPEPLDALPLPKRNVMSINVRLNRDVLREAGRQSRSALEALPRGHRVRDVNIEELLSKGLGNQVGLHFYDASPLFDLNAAQVAGMAMGSAWGNANADRFGAMLPLSFLVASLNSPVYMTYTVRDPKIVDKFLDELDDALAAAAREGSNNWLGLNFDFYKVQSGEDADRRVRCYAIQFGPLRWRFYFARIDNLLCVASKRFILDDLAGATKALAEPVAPVKPDKNRGGPEGHAMVRVRPENWNLCLPEYKLAWAEGNRLACFDNLVPLAAVARSEAAAAGKSDAAGVIQQANALYGANFYCPEGGKYTVAADRKSCTCSVHGDAQHPRQPAAPLPEGVTGKVLSEFAGATVTLTFLEDGLHAVLTVERK